MDCFECGTSSAHGAPVKWAARLAEVFENPENQRGLVRDHVRIYTKNLCALCKTEQSTEHHELPGFWMLVCTLVKPDEMQQDREEMKEFVQAIGATYGRLGMGRPWRAVCGRRDTQLVLQHSCSEQKSLSGSLVC